MTTCRTRFILMIAATAVAICGASNAQTLIGSAGAGWQTWNLAQDVHRSYIDLNSNGAPFWDVPLLTFGGYNATKSPANKSVGWCLTSTGDCQGLGSAVNAPGPLPFWGGPYDSVADDPAGPAPGAIDPVVYFKTSSPGQSFQATLYLNSATNTYEINEFGWFETNITGTVKGTRHVLFQGAGNPPGTNTPDPVGKVVNFTPTQYFGYYYLDVSDAQTLVPYQGCLAFTILSFNDSDCSSGQGLHNFAIFLQQVPNRAPIYWVAGQDPSSCSLDGDCNLTIVKVRHLPLSD